MLVLCLDVSKFSEKVRFKNMGKLKSEEYKQGECLNIYNRIFYCANALTNMQTIAIA